MIKPYYETELGALYHGDCLAILPQLTEKVDLVLTDPPYNIADSNKLCKQGNKIVSNKEMWGHFEPEDTGGWLGILKDVLILCHAQSNGSIFLFYDRNEIHKVKDILENIGYCSKSFLLLVKNNPLPHFNKNGFRSSYEMCLFAQKIKNKDTFNFLRQEEMTGIDYYNIGQKDSVHPTEKPLAAIDKYIRIGSNKGNLVLDPFLGSGTTAVACERLGHRWIGIEISKEYCDIAVKRIEEERSQLKLPL